MAIFGRPIRGSFSMLVQPRLISATQYTMVFAGYTNNSMSDKGHIELGVENRNRFLVQTRKRSVNQFVDNY